MNCRAFKRNLEDYLQGGLDFSARFRMERHAGRCILCGRELAGAQRLSKMALELERVKAPPGFESALLGEIAKRRLSGIIPFVQRFWIYGFEWLSWRKTALAALSVAILGAGSLYLYNRSVSVRMPSPPLIADDPASVHLENRLDANSVPGADLGQAPALSTVAVQSAVDKQGKGRGAISEPRAPGFLETRHAPEMTAAAGSQGRVRSVTVPDLESLEADYVEHVVPGLDNRPVTVRLPKAIRVQYGQTSEEYFIRNVSH